MRPQIELHLHTNTSCNLYCAHCYNNSGVSEPSVLPSGMILDAITAFCDRYDAEIHLEGGEIFLLAELLSEMDALPDEILRHITITTNGTIRLQEPRVLSMLTRIGALRVSVEGHTDEQQRSVRGIALAPVLDTASFYQSIGAPVWLRVTLNRGNCEAFAAETVPQLICRGFERLQVYEFQKAGRGQYSGKQFALGPSIEGFLASLEAQGSFSPASLRFMFPNGRRQEICAHKEALVQSGFDVQLIGAERGVSIHADGGVYLCPWDNDQRHCLANIRSETVEEVLRRLDGQDLIHTCGFCSAVRIVC